MKYFQPILKFNARAEHWLASGGNKWILIVGLLVIWGAGVYRGQWNRLPNGHHEWAQSDRCALAFQFYKGGAFFEPKTYSLFPLDQRVGVELPIQSYGAAKIAQIFRRPDFIVPFFRLFTLLASLAGGLAVAQMLYRRTGSGVLQIQCIILCISSPLVVYFSNNFLPDLFAVGIALCGWNCLDVWRNNQKNSVFYIVLGIVCLTTAALVKISLLVSIVAAFMWIAPQIYDKMRKKSLLLFLLFFLSVGLIGAEVFWIRRINATYHSAIFTTQLHPVQNIDTLFYALQFIPRHIVDFLTFGHYAFLIASIFAVIKFRNRFFLASYNTNISILLIIAGVGGLFIFLGKQWPDHDYYLLSAVFPYLMLGFVYLIARWERLQNGLPAALLLLLCPAMLAQGYARYRSRVERIDFMHQSHRWIHYKNAGAELTQSGVSPDANLLVFGEIMPNLALLYADRNGLVIPIPALKEPLACEDLMRQYNLSAVICARETYPSIASNFLNSARFRLTFTKELAIWTPIK